MADNSWLQRLIWLMPDEPKSRVYEFQIENVLGNDLWKIQTLVSNDIRWSQVYLCPEMKIYCLWQLERKKV